MRLWLRIISASTYEDRQGLVATAAATPCDVIFCSEEIADRLLDRAKVPVITVVNFNDPDEVKEKVMGYINSLEDKQ